MLQEAHTLMKMVLMSKWFYRNTLRKETEALLEGLPVIPVGNFSKRKRTGGNGCPGNNFLRPEVVIVMSGTHEYEGSKNESVAGCNGYTCSGINVISAVNISTSRV